MDSENSCPDDVTVLLRQDSVLRSRVLGVCLPEACDALLEETSGRADSLPEGEMRPQLFRPFQGSERGRHAGLGLSTV